MTIVKYVVSENVAMQKKKKKEKSCARHGATIAKMSLW